MEKKFGHLTTRQNAGTPLFVRLNSASFVCADRWLPTAKEEVERKSVRKLPPTNREEREVAYHRCATAAA